MRVAGTRVGWAAVAASLTFGCFFYDSNWGASKRAQVNAAKHYTPAGLRRDATGASTPRRAAATRVLKARVYAARGYVVETTHWKKRFADVVLRANDSLAAELGVRLELESSVEWQTAADGADLYALIDELAAKDPGEGADFVIGLTGSLPKLVFSFHQLGVGSNPGKHIVLRASNDAVEYSAIQGALDELDEGERARVYRSRLLHKATSVLLHELGHTLGAPHSREPSDVMFAHYSTDIQGFAPATRALLGASLAEAENGVERARALAAALRAAPAAHWVEAERDALLARLDAASRATAAPTPASSPAASATASNAAVPALRPEHQARYREAVAALDAGRLDAALAAGGPLFAEYPGEYAVQDLRCRIAMARNQGWNSARAECEPLMRLMPAMPK